MKKFIYTLCTFTLAASFTSCEMKDELWGDRAQSEKIGRLEVNVTNKATISTETRATADDNGLKPGVFPAEEVDVNNYTLKVFDQENEETEVTSGLISDLGSNGKVTLALKEGNYTVKAYNYDGSNVNVSTRPYFLGTSTLSILPGKTTSTAVSCKLQNIEVAISLDQSFKSSFQSDYEITVDNGAGAIQTFTADNIGTKYYFMVPEDKNNITVSVKANTVEDDQFIQRTYTVTKPDDAEGDNTLAGGDAFIINLTEDGSTSSYIDFGMTVDFSFAEQEEVIEIPAENITFDENSGGGEEGGGETPEPTDAITFIGLPAEYTNPATNGDEVKVTMNATNGIKNIFVNISSENAGFNEMLSGLNFDKEFDLVNPSAEVKGNLIELGLIQEGVSIEGKTTYIFDVTGFMGPLEMASSGLNTFSIRVVDLKDNEASGDLRITVVK